MKKLAVLLPSLLLGLSACKTTPLYTDGDVHLLLECQPEDQANCLAKLQRSCERDFKGSVYDKEDIYRTIHILHVTCRPTPKDPKDKNDHAAQAPAQANENEVEE
ncbi:hypothetical protein [Brackiella oedipodis]|uniref:hypothetical protein n=1 Tax=Brackiella oedipodis TaxID=124225 RepID=UPI00048B15B6|nr:hypothetical protein [Brackiella oedipodis]